ncbi:MAG: NlpC/P60 family protein [Ignavibacteriales bacterium]|nr:MAG: NlpC/P60 family protein [Ignavibacteriales bacterium]
MNILNRFFKKIICAILVLMIFSGCSSSSSTQRFKQSKSDRNGNSNSRFETADTTKRSSRTTPKNERIVFNDLPADTSAEFDEIPVEENPVDKTNFVSHFEKLKTFNVALTPREKVLFEVIKYLETPYKYGGNTQKGMDCSAFTLQVYQNSLAIEIPRSASEQYSAGEKVSMDELKFGDLVFFNTTKRSFPGHVGIYLGENQFVHASRSIGVTVSSLEDAYYKKRFVGARRVETIGEQ